MDFGTF